MINRIFIIIIVFTLLFILSNRIKVKNIEKFENPILQPSVNVELESVGSRDEKGIDIPNPQIYVKINNQELFSSKSQRKSVNGFNLITILEDGSIREIDSYQTDETLKESDRLLNKLMLLKKQNLDRFIILIVQGDGVKQLSDELKYYLQNNYDTYKLNDLPFRGSYMLMYDYKRKQTVIEEMSFKGKVSIKRSIPLEGEYKMVREVIPKMKLNMDAIYYDKVNGEDIFRVFINNLYTDYNVSRDIITEIKETKIIPNLNSAYSENLNAVMKMDDIIYYFKGDSYYNDKTKEVMNVKSLRLTDPDFLLGNYDAVVGLPNGVSYIFKGNKYVRYNWKTKISGNSQMINNNQEIRLQDIFKNGFIETGTWSGKDSILYLIKEEKVLLFDASQNRVVEIKSIYDIFSTLIIPFSNKLQNCHGLELLQNRDVSNKDKWRKKYNEECRVINEDELQDKMKLNEMELQNIKISLEDKRRGIEDIMRKTKDEEVLLKNINDMISDVQTKIKELKVKGCSKNEECKYEGRPNEPEPTKCDTNVINKLLQSDEFTKDIPKDKLESIRKVFNDMILPGNYDIRTHKDYHKFVEIDKVKPCQNSLIMGPNIPGGYLLSEHPEIKNNYVLREQVKEVVVPKSVKELPDWENRFIHKSQIPLQKTAKDFRPEEHPDFINYMKQKSSQLINKL